MRAYKDKFIQHEDDFVVSVKEWITECKDISFSTWDGHGYWVRDGYINRSDEVFSSDPEDATHVVWYNK